jgi:hypothetical protein
MTIDLGYSDLLGARPPAGVRATYGDSADRRIDPIERLAPCAPLSNSVLVECCPPARASLIGSNVPGHASIRATEAGMRAGTRLTVALVAIMMAAAMLWSVPASSAAAAAPSVPSTYRDYLGPSTGGVTVAAGGVGADQCASTVGNRTGRWACPATGGTPAAAPAGYWDWCDAWSCRHRTDDFKSDEQLNATWGCGGTTLGAV